MNEESRTYQGTERAETIPKPNASTIKEICDMLKVTIALADIDALLLEAGNCSKQRVRLNRASREPNMLLCIPSRSSNQCWLWEHAIV
jgi:hypothetical protein